MCGPRLHQSSQCPTPTPHAFDSQESESMKRALVKKDQPTFNVGFGRYTILLLSMLYVVWHTQGVSGGRRILRNRRAIVLQ